MPIDHGSNSIYRKFVGAKGSKPAPGYAAFKVRFDGQEPSKYNGDGLGNAYHIGLVDSSGQYVLNAKGAQYGFARDKVSAYSVFAPLKAVSYVEGEEDMATVETLTNKKATVTTVTGGLNIRPYPSTAYKAIGSIPKGASVTVTSEAGDWYGIEYNDVKGYASALYLTLEDNDNDAGGSEDNDATASNFALVTGADGEVCLVKMPFTVSIGGDD